MRLVHAQNMWFMFSAVTPFHNLYRDCPPRTHEKQSTFPPTKCRSEWQLSVYRASKTVPPVSTSEPTLTPNVLPPSAVGQIYVWTESMTRITMNTSAMYKK